jgi:hypothetical protein
MTDSAAFFLAEPFLLLPDLARFRAAPTIELVSGFIQPFSIY